MTSAIFYRPSPRWQIWTAFCGAVLIHVAAVALAERSATEPPGAIDEQAGIEIIPIVEDPQPVEPVDPPPDLAPPPPPTTDNPFIEDDPTPPPVRPRVDRAPQRVVRAAPAARMTMGSAKVLALSAPRPEYPYEARRQRATGSGVALLTIDPSTGYVADVRMLRSTGNAVLDSATMSGFRRWRFKPGTVSSVQSAITYTLTGASF